MLWGGRVADSILGAKVQQRLGASDGAYGLAQFGASDGENCSARGEGRTRVPGAFCGMWTSDGRGAGRGRALWACHRDRPRTRIRFTYIILEFFARLFAGFGRKRFFCLYFGTPCTFGSVATGRARGKHAEQGIQAAKITIRFIQELEKVNGFWVVGNPAVDLAAYDEAGPTFTRC